ncbi:MAG: sulfite exporter TauE/SafE family protein [Mangrovibacterium sp.]
MIFFSAIEPIYYLLPLIGLLVGLFGTMLGGGGGFIFLPVLTLVLKVPAQTAVITSLVATLPVCMVGSVGHYHRSNIHFRIAALFAATGIAGAFIGAGIANRISAAQLKDSFGIYSLIIALNMLLGAWKKKRERKRPEKKTEKIPVKTFKGTFFGLFAGMITGTFGTSGTAPVLAGLFSMNIPVKVVFGTSLLIVLCNTLFAVGAHFLVGQIDLTLVGFLSTGSAIGAVTGPRLLAKIKTECSEHRFRYGYAALMAGLGILMIWR